MSLQKYNKKRDFSRTAEPEGDAGDKRTGKALRFVVQEHHASHLHYDLRLEMGGVLKSWAVPKGPSLDPKIKRLAVMTEDHPIKYLTFHGSIPKGNYGAGEMAIWDTGTYTTEGGSDPEKGVEAGKLIIEFKGKKLRGEFHMFRLREEEQWLMVKSVDDASQAGWVIEPMLDTNGTSKGTDSDRLAAKATTKTKTAAPLKGEIKPMPAHIRPMLATLVDDLPPSGEWVYEVKWDGYRAVCFIEGGKARLISRNGNDLTPLYPALAQACAALPVKNAVIDGEIVALNDEGRPRFQILQNASGIRRGLKKRSPKTSVDSNIVLYAFDLIHQDGHDYTALPLTQRKEQLAKLIEAAQSDTVRYSRHYEGRDQGATLLAHAGDEDLEGVVAKSADSRYVQRRTGQWLKIKLKRSIDVVIAGYTSPRSSRKYFASLILAIYDEGKLQFMGHAGTGFNDASLKEIYDLMQPLRTENSPFAGKVETNGTPQWLRPELVCEIGYGEITSDYRLRHPVFMGLRHDKDAAECKLQPAERTPSEAKTVAAKTKVAASKAKSSPPAKPGQAKAASPEGDEDVSALLQDSLSGNLTVKAGGHVVKLTHLDKVYWPESGFTKGDLLRYYYQISDTMLPYLKDRPLILKRYPNGTAARPFFQHDIDEAPEFLQIFEHREAGSTIRYAVCNNLASLLYLANLGTITQNPWNERCDKEEVPDWFVFDLDPGEVSFDTVCELGIELNTLLDQAGLKAYAKTSGSRGLHVYLPLERRYTYDHVTDFGMLIAELVRQRRPDLVTVERTIKKRPAGMVYLDLMQNRSGKSVAAPWSPRSRPAASVSTPLSWAEVASRPDPSQFTLATVPEQAKRRDKFFRGVIDKPQRLERAMEKLTKLIGKEAATTTE